MAATGRFGDAQKLIASLRASSANDPEVLLAQSTVFLAWGRLREARDTAVRAEGLGLRRPEIHRKLGWICFRLGQLSESEKWLRKALEADQHDWQLQLELSAAIQAQQRVAEAEAAYVRVLNLRPNEFDAILGLGGCLLAQGDLVGAEREFRHAVGIENRAAAWSHLGVVLSRQLRFAEADSAFERAAVLALGTGDSYDALVNRAINLRDVGRASEAITLFENIIQQHPSPYASLCYAHALLKMGRFSEGWIHYEFRWANYPLLQMRPKYHRPVWAGQDLHGKIVLLHQEQGIGDTIQFIRYAPILRDLGASKVLLRCSATLYNLAKGFQGIDQVLGPGDISPNFDYFLPLLSFPHALRTTLETIPAQVPYLFAKPTDVARMAQFVAMGDEINVGIAWAGSSEHAQDRWRSISLADLTSLGQISGVRFFSLQKGERAMDLAAVASTWNIVNLDSELEDLCDTAAVISQLDLVLCVDTAVAHLAGALGKPVWIMIAEPPDFRWLERREDSPWYPTVRLFRQEIRGDWGLVISRVREALNACVQSSIKHSKYTVGSIQRPSSAPVVHAASALGQNVRVNTKLTAVAETRHGIVQYLHEHGAEGLSIGWYGEWLQYQLSFLERLVAPGSLVVEVGAGHGMHAIALATAAGSLGHLILYEKHPIVRELLRQNLVANGVANGTVMQRGVGNSVSFHLDMPSLENEGVAADSNVSSDATSTADTLDALYLERLNWLKVNDADDALAVLGGAEETLWRLRPWLFLAAKDSKALAVLSELVGRFSYRCWQRETPLFNPENFNRRNNDVFLGKTSISLLAFPEEVSVEIPLDQCIEL